MDLVDRYVKAVSGRLPQKRRADVEWELRSAIMDAVDGRGARSDDDVAAVLREFGDPATVAAGYAPEHQYLIGPELFPAYRRVLGFAITAMVALSGLWFALQLALGRAEPLAPGDELMRAIELAIQSSLSAALVVTVTFVLMQRSDVARATKREWDPRTLPAVLDADRASRLEATFSIVVLIIAIAAVGAIGHEARAGIDRAPIIIRPLLEGALIASIPWFIASMLLEVVMQVGLLLQGRRRLWTRALHLLSDGLAVVAFAIAGVAVFAESGALITVGLPNIAVTVLGLSLMIVAGVIAVSALAREHRLSQRRAAERAGNAPAPPPVLV